MVLITLPVQDLERSRKLFEHVGFTFDDALSFDGELTMIVEGDTYVVLTDHDHFAERINGSIADASKATAVLTTISRDSRDEVDSCVARALAAGATAWKPTVEIAPVYAKSFQDPDGHIWEILYADATWSEESEPS